MQTPFARARALRRDFQRLRERFFRFFGLQCRAGPLNGPRDLVGHQLAGLAQPGRRGDMRENALFGFLKGQLPLQVGVAVAAARTAAGRICFRRPVGRRGRTWPGIRRAGRRGIEARAAPCRRCGKPSVPRSSASTTSPPGSTTTGTTTYPNRLPSALRITRPTACTTSTWLSRGSRERDGVQGGHVHALGEQFDVAHDPAFAGAVGLGQFAQFPIALQRAGRGVKMHGAHLHGPSHRSSASSSPAAFRCP